MTQPALVNATPADPPVEAPAKVLTAYHDHQKMTGRGNTSSTCAAQECPRRTRGRRVATPGHLLVVVIGREHLRRGLDGWVSGCRVDECGLRHIGPSHGSA